VNRDVKAVHGDVTALLAAGILQKRLTARLNFPTMPSMWISCCKLLNSQQFLRE